MTSGRGLWEALARFASNAAKPMQTGGFIGETRILCSASAR